MRLFARQLIETASERVERWKQRYPHFAPYLEQPYARGDFVFVLPILDEDVVRLDVLETGRKRRPNRKERE